MAATPSRLISSPPPSSPIFTPDAFLVQPSHFILVWDRHQICIPVRTWEIRNENLADAGMLQITASVYSYLCKAISLQILSAFYGVVCFLIVCPAWKIYNITVKFANIIS